MLPMLGCFIQLIHFPLLVVPVHVGNASVARKVSGFMSDPNKQAMSYWYLGTAALTTALACLAAPGPFASFMFGGVTDPVVNTLVRAAGATLVTSAAVKYTLKVR